MPRMYITAVTEDGSVRVEPEEGESRAPRPKTVAQEAAAARTRHKKPYLPEKVCPTCQRPFVWRKKWAKDWDNVIYCSHACHR